MRLNKFLAKCGIGSRRSCDQFIKDSKIGRNPNLTQNIKNKNQNNL